MNQLAQQTFRPTRQAWNQQLKAWGWLLLFIGLLGIAWFVTRQPFLVGIGVMLGLGAVLLIFRTIAIAQSAIVFYPSHYTMQVRRNKTDLAYSEILALSREKIKIADRETDMFILTLREGNSLLTLITMTRHYYGRVFNTIYPRLFLTLMRLRSHPCTKHIISERIKQ